MKMLLSITILLKFLHTYLQKNGLKSHAILDTLFQKWLIRLFRRPRFRKQSCQVSTSNEGLLLQFFQITKFMRISYNLAPGLEMKY